ncbi:MAG: hypothetical protein GY805_04240 [Chloroflexi bacterium]|nr:hypothetical protein [Chloroflexota bacterium]
MNWIFAKRTSWLGRWLPLLLVMGVIFFASHQPPGELPNFGFGFLDIGLKKGGHFLGYALLALCGMRALLDWKRPYLTTLVVVLLYALSDEFHQTFIPGRNGALADIFIDMSGALLCLFLLYQRPALTQIL